MVLVIRAPRAAARINQPTDHQPFCSGPMGIGPPTRKACTIEAITAAAAGVGIPTKYLELPGAIPWTLKRASLHAQQMRNARQPTQANSPSWWSPSPAMVVTLRNPQA